jgi:hypothetical protein
MAGYGVDFSKYWFLCGSVGTAHIAHEAKTSARYGDELEEQGVVFLRGKPPEGVSITTQGRT